MIASAAGTGARHRWAMLRQALWYLLLALALLLGIGILHYYAAQRAERAELFTSERLNVALGKIAIVKALEGVESDLAYLVAHNQARGLFRPDSAGAKAALAEDFFAFVAKKKVYDQVRFLDLAGMEQVRVNLNSGNPVIVSEDRLQNKADRYYVEDTRTLERGQTYVSPFDLNVEQARIELPIKPVIRFGTPVFEPLGGKCGMLWLNYLGDSLLSAFRTATANVSDHVMLVNADGFWMSSPQRGDEWGFMRGQERTFGSKHGAAWERMRGEDTGQLETPGGIFTFATIDPDAALAGGARVSAPSGSGPRPWKVIAHVPPEALYTAPNRFIARYLPLYLVMLLALAAAALLLGRATVRHRLAEAQVEFERRFREILENIQLKVVGVDRAAKVTFCNDAILELVGRERANLLGRDWIETLVAPESRDECREMFASLLAGESVPSRYESWVTTHNAERRLVAWNVAPVQGPAGPLAGVTFLGEDITEARQAEVELLKLSRAVEQSPSTVMITDTEGHIEYVNPKFTALTGYSLDEVRGMNPRVLKSDKTTPAEYADMWKAISTGSEWRGVFQNRKKNGELYWEAATISAVRNREGEIANYLAVKEDITERRILEGRFRHCVESAPSAMVLVNHEGNMVLINREAERMFGYQREDLLGRPVEMLVPEANRAAHAKSREDFLTQPRSRAMGIGKGLSGQHRDGHLFPIEAGLHTVESDEGRMALAAIVDITERRQLEEELNDRNQEIAKTQALAAVGRMANMVAHDLRNPLSSIKMGLQIIGKHGAGRWSEQEVELREIALEQVRYMEEVLDDLLSYSRENSLAPEWLQVDKLLDAAILLVQKHIDEHNVKITTRYQVGLPTLHSDPTRLRRAFCNLILNGIQAVEGVEGRRPELTISTHLELAPDRPKIRVSICDNGRGLDADHASRAFEPFFTTRAMGTGLGLAIVKRIVEQHDGTVELLPGDISGTCASVILPTGPINVDPRRRAARGPGDLDEEHAGIREDEPVHLETTR